MRREGVTEILEHRNTRVLEFVIDAVQGKIYIREANSLGECILFRNPSTTGIEF